MRHAGRLLLVSLVLAGCAGAHAEGITVSGRVLGPGGAPLSDVEVELLPLLGEAGNRRAMLRPESVEPVGRGRTNAQGRFRMEAPRVGLWRARISADGFVPLVTDLRPLIEPVVLPDAKLRTDSGMNVLVTDSAGQPLPGATVLLSPDGRFFSLGSRWRLPPRFGTTDGEGKTRLPRADIEKVALSSSAQGYALVQRRGVRGTAATLQLPQGRPLELQVVSDTGTAEPGILVALGRGLHPVGFTDEAGRFAVRLGPGPARKLALEADDGRRLETRIEVAPPPTETDNRPADSPDEDGPDRRSFALPGQLAVTGKLIDTENRRPVAGGLVWDTALPDAAALSDGGGRFTLVGPVDAKRMLTAGAAGHLPAEVVEFQPAAGRPGPTLALRRAASIEGRVVTGDGEPVAGVEVTLRAKPSSGFAGRSVFRFAMQGGLRSVSGPEGRFRLSPVDPDSSWLVRASAEGFAPAEAAVAGLEPGRTRSGVEVTLETGLTISGTVVDESATPLGNVLVELTPAREGNRFGFDRLMGDDSSHESSTDADGRFALHDLPPGKFDLEARRTGFAKRRMSAIEVDERLAPVDLGEIRLAPGEAVSGHVSDPDGRAVEGAEVRASSGPRSWSAFGEPTDPDAVTDSAGWFRVGDLGAGEQYTLQFQHTGFVAKSLRAVEAPRAEPLQVELEPASEVRGRIADPDDAAVAGASVRLTQARSTGMGRTGAFERPVGFTQTDDDGRFVFESIAPGTVTLVAEAAGFQEGRIDDLEVLQGQNLDDLELRLDEGAVVQGQVTAPDGRPVIGARVKRVSEQTSFMMFGGATDGDGRYRLEGLAPGEVSVEATHEDYPRIVRDVELRSGTIRLDLRFEGGVAVTGRVLDAAGNAVLDASVQLLPAGRSWGGPRAQTGTDGSFELVGVQDGDYSLSAEAQGYAGVDGEQSVRVAGESIQGLEVRLAAGTTLYGNVSGLDPESLGAVTVRATAESFRNSRSGVVDYQGAYRLEHLLPGSYQVVASQSGSGRQARGTITIEVGSPPVSLDLVFEEGLVLSGRAVQGEAPVAGATVLARGVDVSHGSSVQTDPDGRFELEGLEAGRYRVSLYDWRSGLSHEEPIELSTSREIVLRVPTAVIAGEVVDGTDRQPLSGVSVFAERSPSSGGRPVTMTATSNSSGRFEVANLADGEWRLTSNKQGYAAVTRTVVIQSGQSVDDLSIAMDATEGLTLQVRLPSGAIPDQVYAAVMDGAGTALVAGSYATSEGGRVRLSSVPPGTWELLVSAPGAATTTFEASAPGPAMPAPLQPASRLRIRLPGLTESTSVATVRVQGDGGRPFRSIGWGGNTQSEWRVTNARLELSSLPPGGWTVTATTPDGGSWQGRATTTAGSTTELVLE